VAITLGNLILAEAETTVIEKHEEVGGRDGRTIQLTGVVLGESSVAGIEARLDDILGGSSTGEGPVALSLRTGRRLWIRRTAFSAEVARDALVGSFDLKMEAENPFEESLNEQAHEWNVAASGDSTAIASQGNAAAVPVVTLVATGNVVSPCLSDGTRTLAYEGTVPDGSALVIDGVRETVTMDGEDVTPYTEGHFPRIAPEGTTLVFSDGLESSHCASVTIAFRDRWW
jgi:tail protein